MSILKNTFSTVFAVGTAAATAWAAFFGGPVGVLNVAAVLTWALAPFAALALLVGVFAPVVMAKAALHQHSAWSTALSRICLLTRLAAFAWSGFIFTALLEAVILFCNVCINSILGHLRQKYSRDVLSEMAGAL